MKDELKEGIRSFLKVNNIDNLNVADLIDEYESEQIFTELKDGSFEMVTGNTIEELVLWLHEKLIR